VYLGVTAADVNVKMIKKVIVHVDAKGSCLM
jgi:hypothetical protein